jgi:hypothetical protein
MAATLYQSGACSTPYPFMPSHRGRGEDSEEVVELKDFQHKREEQW